LWYHIKKKKKKGKEKDAWNAKELVITMGHTVVIKN